jgi:hypothetical protein
MQEEKERKVEEKERRWKELPQFGVCRRQTSRITPFSRGLRRWAV